MKACVVVHVGTTKNVSPALSFRRQRARERQQKLLAEFASRQKSFMETAMDVGKKAGVFLSVVLYWKETKILSAPCVV